MTSAMLQMIFVGTLLLLSDRASAAGVTDNCINHTQLQRRIDKYNKYWNGTSISKVVDTQLERRTEKYYKYWNGTSISKVLAQEARACAQAAKDMYGNVEKRSLSPWKHYIDHDADRIPPKISFAKCLCRGCIFSNQEDDQYNSVPVFSELMVLKKTACPSNPRHYVVQKYYIQVPVGCTCVVPNYVK